MTTDETGYDMVYIWMSEIEYGIKFAEENSPKSPNLKEELRELKQEYDKMKNWRGKYKDMSIVKLMRTTKYYCIKAHELYAKVYDELKEENN